MSRENVSARLRQRILERANAALSDPGRELRPDAAAWVLIALHREPGEGDLLSRINAGLMKAQLEDGRVPVNPRFPNAPWPTPLAVLAWIGREDSKAALDRAVQYLLTWRGRHWINREPETVGHDTSIPGWPWVSGTHSWIEPTGLCMLALRGAGRGNDERCALAARMILNRQLPSGGWNYGNTTVFQTQLRPMPHSTGVALAALAGSPGIARQEVAKSIDYLTETVGTIRAPLSLGWSLTGLAAWDAEPPAAPDWIAESLEREKELPEYDLSLLSVLYCAAQPKSENPLLSLNS
ncbi:MAG TPA: hypothetical protein GYA07_00550 [Verrucomicrobia bacterium]|nr:hypothetical protein [Verrucomicrobiota bacterium]HOB32493.1 hypothetical protein [Verrucomicrobiota bacterium]HOP98136.1 hypothetical protein [Verrucomicrobiota bacterium]HPU56583.1 hypothetical protein [Verrucomicrobiota bacterium]